MAEAQAPVASMRVGKRPTREELAERLDFVYDLVCRGLLKSQIKTLCRKRYGNLSARTIERYLSRARERLIEESGQSKEEMRAQAAGFYAQVVRDGTASTRDRIEARARLDKLFGLDLPIKIAPTDPTGEDAYLGLDQSQLIERILERLLTLGAATDAESATTSGAATDAESAGRSE